MGVRLAGGAGGCPDGPAAPHLPRGSRYFLAPGVSRCPPGQSSVFTAPSRHAAPPGPPLSIFVPPSGWYPHKAQCGASLPALGLGPRQVPCLGSERVASELLSCSQALSQAHRRSVEKGYVCVKVPFVPGAPESSTPLGLSGFYKLSAPFFLQPFLLSCSSAKDHGGQGSPS